jgi:uncharacterized protein YndB with AHSA1/START domain
MNSVLSISPSRALVHTEITIDAPPSKVWAVLRDFEAMASWSSSLKSIRGDISNGSVVTVDFAFGGHVNTITHNLLFQEGVYFGWADPIAIAPGFYDHHIFKVEEVSATQTRFIQSDQLVGQNEAGVPTALYFANAVLPVYEAFNQELKLKVESSAGAPN